MKELTIIGGGVTGLAAAFIAAEQGIKVTVIEKNNQMGGLLACFETPGDPLECFYHHFFIQDAGLKWLLEKLGLAERLDCYNTKIGVFRKGGLYDFSKPSDLLKFKPLSLSGKLRFAATSLYLSKVKNCLEVEDQDALSWFKKWAGDQAASSIWEPMLKIKFGSFAGEVPLAWIAGRLRQRLKSRSKGEEKLAYLKGSLRELVSRIVKVLEEKQAKFYLGREVKSIEMENGKVCSVSLSDGTKLKTENILSTIPSPILSPLLPKEYNQYKEKLSKIEYFGAICVVLLMKKPLSHLYWLNVADPGFPFGGIIEHTNFVPAERYGDTNIAYLSRYLEEDNPLMKEDPDQIGKEWIKHLGRIYPDFREEDLIDVKVFRSKYAATVCRKNFSRMIPAVKSPISGFYAVDMSHIYPDERSVNNAIRVASQACKLMGMECDVPRDESLAGKIGFEAP